MIKYLFQDLFSNKYIRIAFLIFSFLIIFSLIFRDRIRISNFIDNILSRPQFDNPYNWNTPFAYEEDSQKAYKNFEKGLIELIELAAEIYKTDQFDTDNIWDTKFSFQKPWHAMLKEKNAQIVFTLLMDAKRFCKNTFYYESVRERWEEEKVLNSRFTHQNKTNNPYDYAVTKNIINDIRRKIIEIDKDYIFYAQQYKPDFYSAYTLQEDLYYHICKKNTPYAWWERSVSYIEYKHRKKLFYKNQKNKSELTSYEIQRKLFHSLKNDKHYRFYLKNLFFRQKHNIQGIESREKKALSIFILSGKKEDLIEYIKILREKIRVSNIEKSASIHDTIFSFDFRNIEYEYQYVMALAESAFYSHQYNQSRKYINIILNQKIFNTNHEYYETLRLDLILRFKGY